MTFARRSLLGIALLALAGCADPNLIGVQDYGTIYGNAVSSTGQPISNALVSATGIVATGYSSTTGYFSLTMVAVGEQTVTVSSPGYATATADVIVTKGQPVNAGNLVLTVETSTPVNH
jgi:biotin carboxyl carrier protein